MIGPFRYENFFLSNFYKGKPILYKGNEYQTAEHAFQASKAIDTINMKYVAFAATPALAKMRGRQVQMRPDWDFIKERVMYEIVHEKFFQDSTLAQKLIDTGSEDLVEINDWGDYFWGADSRGDGKNKLGKILMKVRNELNAKHSN